MQLPTTTMSADQQPSERQLENKTSNASELATPLHAENIGKRVTGPNRELVILEGLDVRIEAAEMVAIVGPSGSGKSTLLGILAGLDQPTSGQVSLLGQPLGDLDEDQRARLRAGRVGFVFQSFQLLPGLTALENVMLPLELAGDTKAAERSADMLSQVGLSERSKHYPLQLSGGEQQRVAIARAFVAEPALLFADEPTGNLDQETGETIIELMFDLRNQLRSALVLVTHDNALANRCDRCLVMQAGRLDEVPVASSANASRS